MSDLQYYLLHANADQKPVLERQYREAVHLSTITCACGQLRAVHMAYRCLYCGVWFCFKCMERHCGQTVAAWLEKKRQKVRARLVGKSPAQILAHIRRRKVRA